MKRIYLMILLFLIPVFVMGQVEYKEEKTKINSIKKNSNYVYGEGIAETEDEALRLAEESLMQEVTILISEDKELKEAGKIIVQSIKKNSSRIQLKRGSSFRIFLYVEKKRIQNADHTLIIDNPAKSERDTEAQETEVRVESKQEEEEPADPTLESQPTEVEVPANAVEFASPILQQIAACSQVDDLSKLFDQLKSEHKLMWGRVQSDMKPNWYIVVLDGQQVKALLDKGLNTRVNLLTGEKVSLANYANDTKRWFIIYE